MKHKRKKEKRFRFQNAAAGVPEAGLPFKQADATAHAGAGTPGTSAPGTSSPGLGNAAASSTSPPFADVEAARCVSETFLTLPGQSGGATEPLAQRLAAAREAKGWTCSEAASRLRLPVHIVQTIEAGDFEKIGHGIYLRGYLGNYARLVGVSTEAVDEVMQRHTSPPPQLVASGRISHSRFLFDRYSGAALYVVLTGVIFVPLIMFAMNMGGDVGSRLLPLDAPGAAGQPATVKAETSTLGDASDATATQAQTPAENRVASTSTAPAKQSEDPVLASFAPIASAPRPQPDQAAPQTGHNVRLSLAEASWVEIVDSDGKRIEFGILPAGTVRNYVSEKALDVRIGNTNGARLEINGDAQDITPFNHGNVAHFKLFASGKTISRTDS